LCVLLSEIESMDRHRVLIVDDFPDAAEAACILLTLLGHDARFATCGEDALREAAAFDPDIAILDIGLPDLSGFEVARRLRRCTAHALFLAALTGWGQPEDRIKALAAGFDHHVVKPADQEKLVHILQLAEQQRATSDGSHRA
jgi:DNA-binding response OmpR family regulator